MNKFLSLIAVCFILVVADATTHYKSSVTIRNIGNIDEQVVKGDLKFTFKNSESGEKQVVKLDNQILKKGRTLFDHFDTDADIPKSDSFTLEWNLSESDVAKYAKKNPTLELGLFTIKSNEINLANFFEPIGKTTVAPGEIIEYNIKKRL